MTGRRQPRKLECRPVRNGNLLRGFVAFPEVAVHLAGSRAWNSPPRKPTLDRDWVVMRDESGNACSVAVDFIDHGTRVGRSQQIVPVVRKVAQVAL